MAEQPPALPEIVVHHLEQARAVLDAASAIGESVQLRSAPDATAYAGVGYLHALGQALGHELLLDCHDDAGLVMAALRAGSRNIVFSGPIEIHRKLAQMGDQLGAEVRLETIRASEPSPDRLTLAPDDDGGHALRAWLDSSTSA